MIRRRREKQAEEGRMAGVGGVGGREEEQSDVKEGGGCHKPHGRRR